MKPEFTPDGVQVQTYDESYNEFADGLRGIYGTDIDLSPNTPDGQEVGIRAKLSLDLQSFGVEMWNQIDPDLASGTALDRALKYAALTRRPPARSQVDLTVTTDRDLTLPAGYTVEDDAGQLWETDGSASLTTGANTVTAFASEFGNITAGSGTITTPVTIVLGVTEVTNAAAATPGQAEETDAEARIRRKRSTENPSTSTVGGLFTALANLADVLDLVVYENDSDLEDTERSIDPHTVWVVIDGGEVEEIAEVMAKNKTAGCGTKGSVTGTWAEVRDRPNGDEFTITHVMQFDRPTDKDLHIRADVESVSGGAIPETAIKEALEKRTFNIAEDAQASRLYSFAYNAGDGFIVTNLEVSDDGSTWTDGLLDVGYDGLFSIDTANITLTDIT